MGGSAAGSSPDALPSKKSAGRMPYVNSPRCAAAVSPLRTSRVWSRLCSAAAVVGGEDMAMAVRICGGALVKKSYFGARRRRTTWALSW